VSVVGYDNSLDASYAGLTSYSFDITGVVLRMLQCILRPARPGAPASERLALVHGMLIPRATTGAAGGRAE
jgi:DNA-binding LacI/PurR family transcriptional regulator